MRYTIIIFILFLSSTISFTQVEMSSEIKAETKSKTRFKNNINLNYRESWEALSISYERLQYISPNLMVAGKVNIGASLGAHLTANLGIEQFFIEVGIGKAKNISSYPILGIRYAPKGTPLNFRLFMTRIRIDPKVFKYKYGASAGISF